MNLQTIVSVPLGSLDAYIHQVNQIPMLSAEDEYEYAQKFYEQGDVEAARQLVLAHLRYVVRVARNYLGYGLALNDLIQEGNVGLMKAVKRFNPKVGVRLVSFAVHWIKAEIHDFVVQNWRIVKVATTKAQRKLFFNLRNMKKRLGWMQQDEINTIAEDLGVTPKDVLVMEERLNAMDAHYDFDDDDIDDNYKAAPAGYLHDPKADPAYLIEKQANTAFSQEHLYSALARLDERSQEILRERWLNDEEKATSLQVLADKYDISAERVRQLEKAAMQKLQQYMTS
jgi:RNA polymerase sigma-32 factor